MVIYTVMDKSHTEIFMSFESEAKAHEYAKQLGAIVVPTILCVKKGNKS